MEFLKEHLGEELYNQVSDALKDKPLKLADLSSGEYVAKSKFDAETTKVKAANTTLAELQEKIKAFDGVDIDGLKKQAADWETKYNTDLNNFRIDAAVETAIVGAHAKNPKAVKALLNMDSIKLDGENVTGIQEQLNALIESDAYLFGEVGASGSKHEKKVEDKNTDLDHDMAKAMGLR